MILQLSGVPTGWQVAEFCLIAPLATGYFIVVFFLWFRELDRKKEQRRKDRLGQTGFEVIEKITPKKQES